MSIWDRIRIERGRVAWAWGEALAAAQFSALRLAHGDAPIPLDEWQRAAARLEALASREEPLYRAGDVANASDVALPAPLAPLLAGTRLGEWSLDHDTVLWLWRAGLTDRPQRIVECGGGVSTILGAALLRELHGAATPSHLVTLEQDAHYADAVRARIAEAGLDRWVTVVHAPIGADDNYTFDPEAVRSRLGGNADWIVVDGPRESRLLSVPSLAACARVGVRWFLDDALGADYFATTEAWSRWPGIRVDGIVAVGKGLAVGAIAEPAAAVAAISGR